MNLQEANLRYHCNMHLKIGHGREERHRKENYIVFIPKKLRTHILPGEKNNKHLVSGCSKLAGTLYKLRHDRVLKYLHWLLCHKYSLNCCTQWWNHDPAPFIENDLVKIRTLGL